jgi:hypothetical protein
MGTIYPASTVTPFDWDVRKSKVIDELSPVAYAILTLPLMPAELQAQPYPLEWWAERTGYSTKSVIHKGFRELVSVGLAEAIPWKSRVRYVRPHEAIA